MLVYIGLHAQVKVRFELQHIPKSKDGTPQYFMAGSFNNWSPNDTIFRFKKAGDGGYYIDLKLKADAYEFKITRGTWDKVEASANGKTIGNRSFQLKKDTLIQINVANWADEFEKELPKHTASVNVHVVDSAFLIPQLNAKRKVWIYLPPSYSSANKKYPILYMHDGQNLFDEFTGGYGEWGVDELLDSVIAKGGKEYIVVGIDHGGSERLKEYNPYDSQYGKGKGKAYVDFLVNNLKPYIDQHYRTKTDFKNTAIAGSSMGGLISMYAIATYPKVFGSAGIFSPAFWVGKAIETELKSKVEVLSKHKIYFVAGNLEGKMMINDMQSAYRILDPTGQNKNIKVVEKSDGKHNEAFWRREFPAFYEFISK
ncbi:hypothetical protein AQF98_01870 [Pedobacter sp. Hv1]|nr:hypothetical protein AQF98_01870 [Pedobacter sp. Hv1]